MDQKDNSRTDVVSTYHKSRKEYAVRMKELKSTFQYEIINHTRDI